MKYETIKLIKRLLADEVTLAFDSIETYAAANSQEDVNYWNKRLDDTRDAYYDFEHTMSEDYKLWEAADEVKQMLIDCANDPGATIQIVVKRDNGLESSAELYDHAALVQGLVDALDYFQDEIS